MQTQADKKKAFNICWGEKKKEKKEYIQYVKVLFFLFLFQFKLTV